jgi:Asp-tRNA(Asn)/Glu-tRNA(Gln) amidotransferase A subunit family amidase
VHVHAGTGRAFPRALWLKKDGSNGIFWGRACRSITSNHIQLTNDSITASRSMPLTLTIDAIHDAYASGEHTPTSLCKVLLNAIDGSHNAIFIAKPDEARVLARCRFLECQAPHERGPLWGVPFAVKDNIDALGYETTCACPDFAYTPERDAVVVAKLLRAGAIVMGKTNLDQFACGLVGTRSPYGAPPNAFDDRFISGGSSSGSAVAVAKGLVSFALGTDTAGSGRVPAGLNGVVGIKPTVGRWLNKRNCNCLLLFGLPFRFFIVGEGWMYDCGGHGK